MKKIIAALSVLIFTLLTPYFMQPAFADCPDPTKPGTSKDQVLIGTAATGGDCDGSGVNNILSTVVSILSIVVGVAAIIMIIASGLKYVTSGGDSGKVASAKNTLIYALIGIAVAALAQFLVHFVLAQSSKATLPTCGAHQTPAKDNCVAP
jgi:hypothetical protein